MSKPVFFKSVVSDKPIAIRPELVQAVVGSDSIEDSKNTDDNYCQLWFDTSSDEGCFNVKGTFEEVITKLGWELQHK